MAILELPVVERRSPEGTRVAAARLASVLSNSLLEARHGDRGPREPSAENELENRGQAAEVEPLKKRKAQAEPEQAQGEESTEHRNKRHGRRATGNREGGPREGVG